MQLLEELLEHPERDRPAFAAMTAPLIAATKQARRRWVDGFLDGITCGSEEDAIESLHRRTQLEVAREIYRGTVAAEYFENITDDEGDDAQHGRAVDYQVDAPAYVPRSHRWWLWREPR